jgi:hypothetical protein
VFLLVIDRIILTMNGKTTRVFISYSHDSDPHMERVLEFAAQLRSEGVDAWVDRYEHSPAERWPQWCLNQVQESEFVLAICTETYQRRFEGKEVVGTGRGVSFEGAAITQSVYEKSIGNSTIIPVAFSAKELGFIPLVLRGVTFYNLSRPREYASLYLRLTHQPPLDIPPIGRIQRVSDKRGGPIVVPVPLGAVRSAQSLGIPAKPPNRPTTARQLVSPDQVHDDPKEPVIYAKFELRNGKPVNKKGTYKIWVAVRNAPQGTEKVNYEILDDTFPEPKFSVRWGTKDFADWIKTYGDVFLSAKGTSRKGGWRTQTTLLDALKLSYGPRPNPIIRRSMQDIAEN